MTDPVRVVAAGPTESVAALVFGPEEPPPSMPLVLFGHGAHLSKDDPIMQLIARGLAAVPAAVVLMDCPGHGERRPAGQSDEDFDATVRRHMADPATHDQLAAEWTAIAAAAREAVPAAHGLTGYAGFSMGSLFGLSIVHALDDVQAAFFALGGTVYEDRPGATVINRLVRDGAAKLGDREVLMANMTRDESFPIEGAIDVLEAIPGPKRMTVWTGVHADLPPEAISLALRFFRRTLAPRPLP